MVLSSACGLLGGQTGSEDAGEAGHEACKTVNHPLEPNQVSSLGFSLEQLAVSVRGPHNAELAWGAAGNGVQFDRAMTTTTVTLTVEPLGTGRLVHYEPQAKSGIDIGCPADQLELDADITLSTADGGLDEHFRAPLRAASVSSAVMDVSFAPQLIGGQLNISVTSPYALRSLRLNAVVGAAVFRGSFNGLVEQTVGDSVGASNFTFACWPASGGVCAVAEPMGL